MQNKPGTGKGTDRNGALNVIVQKKSLKTLLVMAAFAFAVSWSAKGAKIDFAMLFGDAGRANMKKFVLSLFPPEISSNFLLSLVTPILETIQISIMGIVLGLVISIPFAFAATRTLSRAQVPGVGLLSRWVGGHLPYLVARNVLNFLRTIPELVWALIFITAVGLGSFAGVLALAVHNAGLMGKIYSETMEGVLVGPVEAARVMGGNRFKIAAFALVPQALNGIVSYTLYLWECNIRTATILGFVGAGGIGQSIDLAMRLFRYNELLTLMAAVFMMVFVVDSISALIRRSFTLKTF
ncbi:MAG: phosphonate ABC transporter, permease protein PhnE [Actinobacteria bacterium]|nr:phosphonate ABC transporter, permease protein PhnE [Actinomycetota bacterium]